LPARDDLTGEDTSFWSVKYAKIRPCISGAFCLESLCSTGLSWFSKAYLFFFW
jgi:hypothetical protein